jgi:hypothetical protein
MGVGKIREIAQQKNLWDKMNFGGVRCSNGFTLITTSAW